MKVRSRQLTEDAPTFVGAALVDAAGSVGGGARDDQVVAFDVAGAVRDGGEGAVEALEALLHALAVASDGDVGDGTIVNALTAVQWAAMPASEAFAGWAPPADALAAVVGRALDRHAMLEEQAAQLVGGLKVQGRVDAWLGPRGAELVSRAERLDR